MDPYLDSVKEKFVEAGSYLEERRFSRGIVINLLWDAIMTTLQRMVIDKKGLKVLEQLRKDKKIYFETLISILRKDDVEISNVMELDILRDLRNRVVHEGYRPTEQNVKWAYETVKTFILQCYPEIFQFLPPTKPPIIIEKGKPILKADVEKTFQDFKAIKHFVAGEGITEASLESWHQIRKNAKEKYAILFSQPHLKGLTREDFESFLYYRNNRAWTNLYRRGKEAANKIEDIKKAITYLQNESIDIRVRINSVLLGGSYHVRGMGKNLATAILHICDKEDKYGVWNNRTEGGLQKLGRLPRRTSNKGEFYYRINAELNRLKKELDTDLIIVDSFMWYIDKFK